MEHHRRITYTRFDIKQHLVWITQYRKQLLWEEETEAKDDECEVEEP